MTGNARHDGIAIRHPLFKDSEDNAMTSFIPRTEPSHPRGYVPDHKMCVWYGCPRPDIDEYSVRSPGGGEFAATPIEAGVIRSYCPHHADEMTRRGFSVIKL